MDTKGTDESPNVSANERSKGNDISELAKNYQSPLAEYDLKPQYNSYSPEQEMMHSKSHREHVMQHHPSNQNSSFLKQTGSQQHIDDSNSVLKALNQIEQFGINHFENEIGKKGRRKNRKKASQILEDEQQ